MSLILTTWSGIKNGLMSATDVCAALHGRVSQPDVAVGFWNVRMAAKASSVFVVPFGGNHISFGVSKPPTMSPYHLIPGLACVKATKFGPDCKPSTTAAIS